MKKLPLLLVSMLVMSSAAFAATPVERQRLSADGIGMQQTQAHPATSEARANNYEAQNNNADMHKEKRMHHKKHGKVKAAKKEEAAKDAKAEKAKK